MARDDFGELYELAADLTKAPAKAVKYVGKALEVTGRSITDDWRDGAQIGNDPWNFADDYSRSITYDKSFGPTVLQVEIGPELGKPGGTGGFMEEATGDVRSAPQHAARDAVRANEDDFVRGLEIALFDATAEAVEGS